MSQKRRIILGVLSNYGAFFTYGVSNVILVGYLVRKLGVEAFGIVTLVMSFNAVAQLFGRGMILAATKHIAADIGLQNNQRINEYLNTTFAWLLACALFGAVFFVFLASFTHYIEMPAALEPAARTAFLLMGLRVLLCFPFNAFQAVLFAHQRHDLVNLAKVVTIILRVLVVIAWFECISTGIAELIIITIISLLIERGMWFAYTYQQFPEMRIGWSYVTRGALTILVGFGTMVLIIDVANIAGYEAAKWVLAAELSVKEVGAFTLIATLAAFAGSIVRAIAGVLTPAASRLTALNRHDRTAQLAQMSTKYAMIVAGGLCIAPLPLMKAFMIIWVGKSYSPDYLHTIVWAGQLLLISQWFISTAVCMLQLLTGVGRVKVTALITTAWAFGGLITVWIVLHWGTASLGIAVIVLSLARIIGAIAQLIYSIYILKLNTFNFLSDAVVRPAICALGGLGSAWLLHRMFATDNWPQLFIVGGAVMIVYVILCWWISANTSERQAIFTFIRRRTASSQPTIE